MNCNQPADFSPIFIAIASSLATIFLTALFKFAARRERYKNDVIIYDCVALSHSFGHMVEDTSANSKSGKVWQHDNNTREPGRTDVDCTIYGPYTNDFFEPGRYKVKFRVYVNGIQSNDQILLTIEVARIHILDMQNRSTPFKQLRLTGRDLATHAGEYFTYEFEFYTEGSGDVWEYRAKVNHAFFNPDKMVIRFDTIICEHSYSFWDVFLAS